MGLVGPFLQTPDTELYLLNRATSGSNMTGSTALDPSRRNDLLKNNSGQQYLTDAPGVMPGKDGAAPREMVHYDGFYSFEEDVEQTIRNILMESEKKVKGIVVTAPRPLRSCACG